MGDLDTYEMPQCAGPIPEAMSSHPDRSSQSPILLAALQYASAGFRVFPCRKDKVPHITGWRANATTDEATIRSWFVRWPDAMIGMPCGVSNGIVVIDGDTYKEEFAEALDRLEEECGILPGTVAAQTARGGVHWYFEHPGKPVVGGPGKIAPGIDMIADGQFVILPPSTRKVGRKNVAYRWVSGLGLVGGETSLAELPASIRKRLKPKKEHKILLSNEDPSYRKGLHYSGEASADWEISTPSPSPISLSRPLDGAIMRELLQDPAVAKRVARFLAPWSNSIESFHCVLPEHGERNPSAGIGPGGNGVYVYFCRHGRSKLSHADQPKQVFLLGEVFAYQVVGQEFEMNAPERWIWSIRLLIEAGVLEPADTADFVPLPNFAPVQALAAWEGFRRLSECRRLYTAKPVTPLARRFMGRWSNELSEHHARLGIEWLRKNGYLLRLGTQKRTPLYQAMDGNGRTLGLGDPVQWVHAVDEAVLVSDLLAAA